MATKKMKLLPYGFQSISKEDIAAVVKVLKSDWLTTGPNVDEFEKRLASYVGAKYAVAVCNATAALHLAVAALNPKPGSEGITSAITFLASSNTFLYNNMKPVFADIDEKTYNIDPEEVKKKITANTRVIIPVHFGGQPVDMDVLSSIVKNKKVDIIEDAAHAIGSKYKNGKKVGSCYASRMTIFSFHPVKTMTTGEGGAITTNDETLYKKLKLLRSHGMTKDPDLLSQNPGPWYYEMQTLGYNLRITDFQAALGISQLKRIGTFIKRRREIIKMYNSAFKNISWITTPFEEKGVLSAFHLYVLKINFNFLKKTRVQVMNELLKKGIGTQVHYIPVPIQPYYKKHFGFRKGDFPKAEKYYEDCLSIPLYPALKNSDVQKIITSVLKLQNS